MTALLSVDDYKIAHHILTSDYDAQIGALLNSASDYVRKYCGRQFGPAAYTEKKKGMVDVRGRLVFYMDQLPVLSVQNLEIEFYGAPDAVGSVDVNLLTLMEQEGMAYYTRTLPLQGGAWRPEYLDDWIYTITYSGGESVPAGVAEAVGLIVQNLMEYYNRTNTASASGTVNTGEISSIKIGDYTESYKTSESLFSELSKGDQGLVLTQTVQDLLAPYRMLRMGIA